ncbi:Protein Jade-1 [Balamuthia mandrillaris]
MGKTNFRPRPIDVEQKLPIVWQNEDSEAEEASEHPPPTKTTEGTTAKKSSPPPSDEPEEETEHQHQHQDPRSSNSIITTRSQARKMTSSSLLMKDKTPLYLSDTMLLDEEERLRLTSRAGLLQQDYFTNGVGEPQQRPVAAIEKEVPRPSFREVDEGEGEEKETAEEKRIKKNKAMKKVKKQQKQKRKEDGLDSSPPEEEEEEKKRLDQRTEWWKRPNHLIRYRAKTEEELETLCEYDLDSEDEVFIQDWNEKHAHSGNHPLNSAMDEGDDKEEEEEEEEEEEAEERDVITDGPSVRRTTSAKHGRRHGSSSGSSSGVHRLARLNEDLFERIINALEKEVFKQRQEKGFSSDDSESDEDDIPCCICNDGDHSEKNLIVFCDGCDMAVHQACYGVPTLPSGAWYCDKCAIVGKKASVTCCLCGGTGGALKPTKRAKAEEHSKKEEGKEHQEGEVGDKDWVHVVCALWTPGVTWDDPETLHGPNFDGIDKRRFNLTCTICREKTGACIQCKHKNCCTSFHPMCGRRHGLFVEIKPGKGDSVLFTAYCRKHSIRHYQQRTEMQKIKKINCPKLLRGDHKKLLTGSVLKRHKLFKVNPEVLEAVYSYWVNKRLRKGRPLIYRLEQQLKELWKDSPKRIQRKQRQHYTEMQKLRRDMEIARLLLDLVTKRERQKLRRVEVLREIFEQQIAEEDPENAIELISATSSPSPTIALSPIPTISTSLSTLQQQLQFQQQQLQQQLKQQQRKQTQQKKPQKQKQKQPRREIRVHARTKSFLDANAAHEASVFFVNRSSSLTRHRKRPRLFPPPSYFHNGGSSLNDGENPEEGATTARTNAYSSEPGTSSSSFPYSSSLMVLPNKRKRGRPPRTRSSWPLLSSSGASSSSSSTPAASSTSPCLLPTIPLKRITDLTLSSSSTSNKRKREIEEDQEEEEEEQERNEAVSPRKEEEEEEEQAVTIIPPTPPPMIVKRGPGRPRKRPLPTSPITAATSKSVSSPSSSSLAGTDRGGGKVPGSADTESGTKKRRKSDRLRHR